CERKLSAARADPGVTTSADVSIIGVGANIGSKFGLTIGATPNARSAMREKKSAIFHSIEIKLPTYGVHRQDIGFAPTVGPCERVNFVETTPGRSSDFAPQKRRDIQSQLPGVA